MNRKIFLYLIMFFLPVELCSQDRDTVSLVGGEIDKAIITSTKDVFKTYPTINLSPLNIKSMPATFSERDPLKLVQMVPGIQNNNEGNVNISIRGGDIDQTLVTLDRMPIYRPIHLGGFVSAINSEIISSISVSKDGFAAKYGSILSGVVDMEMESGDMHRYGASASLGMISSSALAQGPIIKDKLSFIISGRISYINLLVAPLYNIISKEDSRFMEQFKNSNYYDINTKLNYKHKENNTLELSMYLGHDQNKLNSEKYGNLSSSLTWKKRYSNNISIDTYIYASDFKDRYTYGDRVLVKNSSISDYSIGSDFCYKTLAKISLSAGFKYSLQSFDPRILSFKNDSLISSIGKRSYLNTVSTYADGEIEPAKWIVASLGIRPTFYISGKTSYFYLEPRVRLRFNIADKLNLYLSYTRMSQAIHLLSSNNVAAPSDIWIPSTDSLKPSVSDSYSIGMIYRPVLFGKELTFSVDGYYKKMRMIIDLKDGAQLGNVEDFEHLVESGDGYSYGIETNVKKEIGNMRGSISYTWSVAKKHFDNINDGNWFYSENDCRHNISVYVVQKLGKSWDVSLSFIYKTGKRITLTDYLVMSQNPFGSDKDIWLEEYSHRNKLKLKDYNRLDIGFNYYKNHKIGTSNWNFSIVNVYNYQNPYLIYVDKKYSPYRFKQVCIFPFMPSIGYTFSF